MKKLKNTSKALKSTKKLLEKECDALWAKAVKLRAGNKSELSGQKEHLNAHHLLGKASYRLRYELENGMCLTAGEHLYYAHHAARHEDFRRAVMKIRGADIFDRLYKLKWEQCKTDLSLVKLYLQDWISKYEAK